MSLSQIIGDGSKQESNAKTYGLQTSSNISEDIHHGIGNSTAFSALFSQKEIKILDKIFLGPNLWLIVKHGWYHA